MDSPKSKEFITAWVIDGIRRIAMHQGFWFNEVEKRLGIEAAHEIESEVFDLSSSIQTKRLSKALSIDVKNEPMPAISTLSRETTNSLLDAVSVNWLVNDGVWFQAVEKRHGMDKAKQCNDAAWSSFSPYEAYRIKKLLAIPESGGLDALKTALNYRLYARINTQALDEEQSESFVFRMVECRVQSARKRKKLDDYPCKSGGIIEYTTFASAIDSRIKTECIACPPDPHPDDWLCSWKFSL